MAVVGAPRVYQEGLNETAGLRRIARDDFDRNVWSILGVPADILTASEAVIAIESAARDKRPLSFVTPNVNFLVRARRDPDARRQILNTDLSLVDGAPLVALGRRLGVPIRERCAGSDVFEALRKRPGFPGRRLKVFFFGGRDGAAAAAAAALNAEGRGVEAAGFLNPGAGDVASMSTPAILEEINRSGADFVVVALGAAKGQAWIDANRARLSAPVVAHLGAVVDFTAGSIRRAPPLFRKTGLEWAWRIKEEPSLWRRYRDDAFFLLSVLAQAAPSLLGGKRGRLPLAPAGATLATNGARSVIRLSGDLVAVDLAAVREAFRAAAKAGFDVILDFTGARRADPAFLGLVLMLEKNLAAGNASLSVAAAPADIRRQLRAHLMTYPQVSVPTPENVESDGPGIAAAV